MIGFEINGTDPLRVLCLGAHCDDIEIGCGGTILELISRERPVECTWVTFCSTPARSKEAHGSANAFLKGARVARIEVMDFRDGFLPYVGAEIKDNFEKLKLANDPDVVFTHHAYDKHQDHKMISDLTYQTFRNHLILEYEIPKYDGDIGNPNLYVEVGEVRCQRKVEILLNSYDSQKSKNWFTENLFMSLLRVRGMEVNAASSFAEAFYCKKFRMSI